MKAKQCNLFSGRDALLSRPLASTSLAACIEHLERRARQRLAASGHGHLSQWQTQLAALPELRADVVDLATPAVTIGSAQGCSATQRSRLEQGLRRFHPWRKGPFSLFGIEIDSEWRSDMKWARVAPHLSDLAGRRVLDVGCGNGYYGWRMLGAGAGLVIGIEPMLLFNMQFQACRRYLPDVPFAVLPVGVEDMPPATRLFDTVFSMGVLYHRRQPQEHIAELSGCLRGGGELVLETLVIDGGREEVLVPQGRYAKMRNVWAIPSCLTLEGWLRDGGFRDIRIVDVTRTTVTEQRRTEWMHFESLGDFLDPGDDNRTVEGYPAPLRATVVARCG